MEELDRLYKDVMSVKNGTVENEKTEKLFAEGMTKIAKKVGEEGVEIAVAAMMSDSSKRKEDIIAESADLFFNLVVLWAKTDVTLMDVNEALARRRVAFGIAEKPGSNIKV